MLSINGRIFVDLKIDDSDLPTSPNLVERLTMTEGNGVLSPAIELVLNDYSGALNQELALTDGNLLTVTIGKSPEDEDTKTRQYRLFGSRQQASAFGPQIRAFGIYDAPEFFLMSSREGFEANSKDVLSEIAQSCKLKFVSGDFTPEDKQIWLNVCQTRATFMQSLIRHARVDADSVMAATITSLGELRYFDLSAQIEKSKDDVKAMLVSNTVDDSTGMKVYKVRESRDRSTAGLMNAWLNYGATRVAHSLEGVQQLFEKIDITTTAGFLPINQQVAKTVNKARIDYSSLDCGNNHKDYWKAYYQNLRLLALFSEHVSVLTTEQTDLELFDPVIYRQANADPKAPVNKTDIYIVIGKTLLVKNGTNYAERLELVRRSLSVKGESTLAGEDIGNAASANPTPDSMIDPTATPNEDVRGTVASIAAPQATAQRAVDQVKGRMPDHSNSALMTIPSMKNTAQLLKKNAPVSQVLNGMTQVNEVFDHYNEQATGINNSIKAMFNPLTTLNNQLTLNNANPAVRQAAMAAQSGIMSGTSSALMVLQQQQAMAKALLGLNLLIKARQGEMKATEAGRGILDLFVKNAGKAQMQADTSSQSTAKIWNSNVTGLSGIVKPGTIGRPIVNKLQSQVSTLWTPNSVGVPRTMTQQTEQVIAAVASKTDTKQPQWVPEEPLPIEVPADVDATLNHLDAMDDELRSAKRREQDLFATDWTA